MMKAGVIALLLVLGACSDMKPFDMQKAGDIPDGPGLFTGNEGAFVLSPARRTGTTAPTTTGAAQSR
jgi:hypothetical protein